MPIDNRERAAQLFHKSRDIIPPLHTQHLPVATVSPRFSSSSQVKFYHYNPSKKPRSLTIDPMCRLTQIMGPSRLILNCNSALFHESTTHSLTVENYVVSVWPFAWKFDDLRFTRPWFWYFLCQFYDFLSSSILPSILQSILRPIHH